MAAIPLLSGQEVVKVFLALGRSISRQRGSHMILTKGEAATLAVPNHKEVARGTLRGLSEPLTSPRRSLWR